MGFSSMSVKVTPLVIKNSFFTVHALAFIPSPNNENHLKSEWAIFTHGYTSHKGDCLNWATRLADAGVPTLIFDQPGHYLGSFYEINSWEDFRDHAHQLFEDAYLMLQNLMKNAHHILNPDSLILGGHSLGAFTAIKASESFSSFNGPTVAVGIGIGIGQRQATHIFETAFYEKTLAIRRQLVSPHLDSKILFSWLKQEKENIRISHKRIHLITGRDDVVVGGGGLKAFVEVLEKNQNIVTYEEPRRLAHHEPGMATPHLYAFLKNYFSW